MFGTRYFSEDQDIFDHNAWDDVELNDEDMEKALRRLKEAENHSSSMAVDQREAILREDFALKQQCGDPIRIVDVGCGVGNTSLMLLENLPPHCLIHGFDCSSKALNAFRQNPNFDQSRCQLSLVDLCDRNDMTARRCELLRDCRERIEHRKDRDKMAKMFGTRYFSEDQDIFDHNAWDDVELNDEDMEKALRRLKEAENHSSSMAVDQREAILREGTARHWEAFYQNHGNKFFKDRRWIMREFID
ncbi:hypothetical protein ACOME3_003120 [Neoechinorhynchus agilis]